MNDARITELKEQIKTAKEENKPYNEVSALQMELVDERNAGSLKGVFAKMRRKSADAFYRTPKDSTAKKELLKVLRESIKEIDQVQE